MTPGPSSFLFGDQGRRAWMASYDQGVLTVRVPVAEKAKPRKVEIKVGEARPLEVGPSA